VSSYRDLEIYKKSYELALRVHRLTLQLPQFELYEEGGQARKSSKGVPNCISEGYGRRKYTADFVKYLTYAQASCDETMVHLEFIGDTHKLKGNELKSLLAEYEKLGKQINKFIQYVEKEWRC
jgi:four helix bundle protein